MRSSNEGWSWVVSRSSTDSIESSGMTVSMKFMRIWGWSGLVKILLNPKSDVREMYFGICLLRCGLWARWSKDCANGILSLESMVYGYVFEVSSVFWRRFVGGIATWSMFSKMGSSFVVSKVTKGSTVDWMIVKYFNHFKCLYSWYIDESKEDWSFVGFGISKSIANHSQLETVWAPSKTYGKV